MEPSLLTAFFVIPFFLPLGGIHGLGKVELLFTGLFQTFGPIGIILLLLGILVLLIPQSRRFIGGIIGGR